jgi:elongation factor P hydroxylase
MLKEAFVVSKATNHNGKPIAYIDPNKPENKDTFKYKDHFKKHGARWDGRNKVWLWYIGATKDKWQYAFDKFIKPALESAHKAQGAAPDDAKSSIIASIDEIMKEVEGAQLTGDDPDAKKIDAKDVKERLKDFKDTLVNIENDEDFKKTIQAIVRFKNAQGHRMSFGNALLVFLQDRNATHVMGKGRWATYNRTVKPDAPAIGIYAPLGDMKSAKEINIEKEQFAKKSGYKSFDEMPVGARDKFNVKSRTRNAGSRGFVLVPAYDIRFTEPIEGKEDLAKDLELSKEIKWYEEGQISEEVRPVYDGLLKFAKKVGINVETVDANKLGGARGVSKSGKIEIINNEGNDVGITKTLAHEIAHELLHQQYLKNKDDEFAKYFVGRPDGIEKVEQQAEIAAWAVMTAYGFDLKVSSMNYSIMWGAQSGEAMVKVFDGVMRVVNRLIDEINAQIPQTTTEEGFVKEDEIAKAQHMDADELAGKLGMGDMLQKAKQNVQEKQMYVESFYKKINYNLLKS